MADLHDRSVISYRFQFGRALGGEGINTESSCCVPKYLLKSESKERDKTGPAPGRIYLMKCVQNLYGFIREAKK